MKQTFLHHIARMFALLIFACGATMTMAAEYPDHVIQMIVPQGTGGGTDLFAHLIASHMSPRLGQPVIVINKPGAGTQLGTEFVASEPANGYTVLFPSSPVLLLPYLRKTNFDFVRDFTPIGQVGVGNFVLAINPNLPFHTAAEFFAAVRANPGKYTFGSAGIGSAGHLALELLKARMGLDLVHVPYKSSGDVALALASGQVDCTIDNLTIQKPQIDSQKSRGLATTGLTRDPGLPNLPTINELKLVPDGYVMNYWFGMFVSSRTPAPIVERLRREFAAVMREPEVTEQVRRMSLVPSTFSGKEFADSIAAEAALWKRIISDAHIQMP